MPQRCPWGETPEIYRAYHDDEWGRPVTDDVRVYEKLCLEGFQSGLSWLTILRKRESFRAGLGSLAALVWRYEPEATATRRPAATLAELPTTTPEAVALSKELRRRGFKFVGPTTVYSAMQALGIVNDHLAGCFAHEAVEALRSGLVRPIA